MAARARTTTVVVLMAFFVLGGGRTSAQAATQAAPAANTFDLTVAHIMQGPELVGSSPGSVRWTDDGRWIYFRWKQGGQPWDEPAALYRVRAAGGAPQQLSDEQADSLGVYIARGDISQDRRWRVVSYQGDLWLINRRSLEARRLTDTRESEAQPVFSRDGRTVYFVRDDNVYALGLENADIRQLTDIRKGPAPHEQEAEGQRAFLENEQKELFAHIRRELEDQARQKERREAREAKQPKPVYIGKQERVYGIMVDPDERWAFLRTGQPADDARQTIVPDYITPSGYVDPMRGRTNVGDAQSSARLALLDLSDGSAAWLDLVPAQAAADTTHAHAGQLAQISFLGWNDDGTKGLVYAMAYDFKDAWLDVVDAATGDLTVIDHEHDDAWLGGPCVMCAGWMPDGRSAWVVSERSGYAQLYRVGLDGQAPKALTSGEWEIHDVEIAPDDKQFYLTTNEGSPFEQHFYTMDLDGGHRTRITSRTGWHDVTPAPDGRRLADVYSTSNRPPELFVMDAKPGAAPRRVTTTPTKAWLAGPWIDPGIIRVQARDGAQVPARIYRPADLGARPNGAAVIFVHGAGYLQNVERGWSSYYREYMFHHLLASKGYVVLDMDYRGSAGYGRDWRTAIYRHMGGKDLTDQVDGARYLVEHEGVDPHRIGIYGGSYGGFTTLMAMFTQPGVFAAGAALRPVSDWAHYNHWYTSRILNLPQDDSVAYRQSSPIYFADGLQGALLICHGMADTNVHFQDTVMLVQRLIELGKKNWSVAPYPVENHGFVEPTSWTDEYSRILKLFERNLGGG
ncbi:MAG TPA: prolyl oligopeptidase family serine peptidase [Longimicrobiales bacterium]|nr:prolyl oligopeptidase family serine peptidase [Longimicrobiales bacterium]